ncbi:sentrin-specific protease 6-like isoform X1 [Labeo rohita]|uniref:Sentrin-specific protease 6-like isoform X1 n=1 Tax=Labeo rohita TaxID=84645 RepID=A0A498LH42_LABRO|nr:sentrin-specific protease 6-like isoform X1 [Labeo rohita]
MEKEKGSFGVPILTKESLATLDDGMWLDDIVMDIQLRSVHDELGPHKRQKSLICPVHFYTKLKNKLLDRNVEQHNEKPRICSADSIPALKVQVPQQQGNSSECGIFVLLYAKHFLNHPPKELIDELDCTSWFTLTDAFSKCAKIRDTMVG